MVFSTDYDFTSSTPSQIYFLRSYSNLSLWSEPTFLSRTSGPYYKASKSPSISFEGDKLSIVWEERGIYYGTYTSDYYYTTFVRFSEDLGISWSQPIELHTVKRQSHPYAKVINDNIYLFYVSGNGSLDKKAYFRIYDLSGNPIHGPQLISGSYSNSAIIKIIYDDNFKVLIESETGNSAENVLYFCEISLDGQFERYEPIAISKDNLRGLGISDFFVSDSTQYNLFFTGENRLNQFWLISEFRFIHGELSGDILFENEVAPIPSIPFYENPVIMSIIFMTLFVFLYMIFFVSLNILIYRHDKDILSQKDRILNFLNKNFKAIRMWGIVLSFAFIGLLFTGLSMMLFGLLPGIFLINYCLIIEGYAKNSSKLSKLRYVYNIPAIWILFACLMLLAGSFRFDESQDFFLGIFFFSPFILPIFFIITLFIIPVKTEKEARNLQFYQKIILNIGEIILFWVISVLLLLALMSSFY